MPYGVLFIIIFVHIEFLHFLVQNHNFEQDY